MRGGVGRACDPVVGATRPDGSFLSAGPSALGSAVAPGSSAVPAVPVAPDSPVAPAVSDAPAAPGASDAPDSPAASIAPPVSPTTPAAPHAPAALSALTLSAASGSLDDAPVTFYVVRHGQTLFNVMGKVQGWCDTPLTPEGVAGAEALGRGLADVEFARVFSSDSGRAVQTASALLEARARVRGEAAKARFAAVPDPRLREWCYGELEGEPGELLHAVLDAGFGRSLSFEEHNRRLPEVADVIANADSSGRAERFDAIEARLVRFLSEAGDAVRSTGGGNVLVVTHSFVVRTLVYLIDPARVNDPVKIPNTSVTRIGYDGERFILGEVGSTDWSV